jgi:hypothetical protein
VSILTDPATVVHAPFCDKAWHNAANREVHAMATSEGHESADYLACSSAPIEIPAGTSHGDALIWQSPTGTRINVEFPHRALDLSADELDATVETLTRLSIAARSKT